MATLHNRCFRSLQRRLAPSATFHQFPRRQRHQRGKSGGALGRRRARLLPQARSQRRGHLHAAGSLAASALVSGDVNAVLTSSNAVLNLAAGGLDVVIIGALFQRLEGDFMARPEFKRPEDLKGKLVAIQSIYVETGNDSRLYVYSENTAERLLSEERTT